MPSRNSSSFGGSATLARKSNKTLPAGMSAKAHPGITETLASPCLALCTTHVNDMSLPWGHQLSSLMHALACLGPHRLRLLTRQRAGARPPSLIAAGADSHGRQASEQTHVAPRKRRSPRRPLSLPLGGGSLGRQASAHALAALPVTASMAVRPQNTSTPLHARTAASATRPRPNMTVSADRPLISYTLCLPGTAALAIRPYPSMTACRAMSHPVGHPHRH